MASETHEVAGDHAAQAAAGHGGEAVGLPQLDFSTFGNQIFWLLVGLVVIYFILSRIALPRISGILSERHGTITGDLAAAEDLKAKAQDAEAAYHQALADARAEANEIVAKAKAEVKAELDAALAKADVKIAEKAAESESRIAEIHVEAAKSVKQISQDITADVIAAMGSKADAKAVTAAVTARLKG